MKPVIETDPTDVEQRQPRVRARQWFGMPMPWFERRDRDVSQIDVLAHLQARKENPVHVTPKRSQVPFIGGQGGLNLQEGQ